MTMRSTTVSMPPRTGRRAAGPDPLARARQSAIWRAALLLAALAAGLLVLSSTTARAAVPVPARCTELAGETVPSDLIGLPTRGALISTAVLIPASYPGNRDGRYCRLLGTIRALDDHTPDIRFEVNLPSRWNGRALQLGGGGYSGELVSGTGPVPYSPDAAPLALGYATFGSDSGHIGTSGRAEFALDDDALVNFGFAHLKKTHDVALALITLGYGRPPDETYFAGGSTGGREGYTIIERFPDDYDGVIADSPAINFSGVRLMGVAVGQAAYGTPGGFLSPAALRLVYNVSMAACDKLDGLADGIISDVHDCRARERAIIAALRCPADNQLPGAETAPNTVQCLTPAQINTLTTLRDGLTLPYDLAYGVRGYSGYNVFEGTDFGGTLGLGSSADILRPLAFVTNGYLFAQADAYLRFFVTRNEAFDTLHFDLANPGRYRSRLVELSNTVGAMNTDLSTYIARGGKLITLQGLADEVISPNQTIAFYRALIARYGQDKVDAFMRLYMVPGYGHGSGVFIPSWNALGALDDWVTHGKAPEIVIATDLSPAANGRTRPICRFPAFPRYSGHGNVNQAASFRCSSS